MQFKTTLAILGARRATYENQSAAIKKFEKILKELDTQPLGTLPSGVTFEVHFQLSGPEERAVTVVSTSLREAYGSSTIP